MQKMKFFICGILIFFVFAQCINSDNGTTNKTTLITINNSDSLKSNSSDTSGFISGCQSWTSEFTGYLQEVEARKDSTGPFCFYECFDCKETYRLIFVHKTDKKGVSDDAIWNEFNNSCADKFKNFECFAFVYPMKNPDKQKDVHASTIKFPNVVKVYERILDDNWKFLKMQSVESFRELTRLQFNIIHHLE
jgi:hypothetical protein